jgi:signal transduction histidine kinase
VASPAEAGFGRRAHASLVAWGICGACLVMAGALSALSWAGRAYTHNLVVEMAVLPVAIVSFAVVGATVASRLPQNIVGWAFLAFATTLAGGGVAGRYAVLGILVAPGSVPLPQAGGWLASWLSIPAVFLLTVFIPVSFPDGLPTDRRWRAFLRVATVCMMLVVAITASDSFPVPGARLADNGQYLTQWSVRIQEITYALVSLLAVPALGSLVIRLRSSTGDRRQQLKWLVAACSVVAASSVVYAVLPASVRSGAPFFVFQALAALGLAAVPAAAGMAILKYRLYDIDIVIRRTFLYGAMAAFITAVYLLVVVGIGAVVGSGNSPNLILSIAATAIVALAFQPVRSRLQRVANRIVYGARATPYEVLSTFGENVAQIFGNEELLPRMARLLASATGASRADIWLRLGEEMRPAASWPGTDQPAIRLPVSGQVMPELGNATAAVGVRVGGELLGAMTVTKRRGEPLTPMESALLDDLAGQAGMVLKNATLMAQLRIGLHELRTSRQRLVAAQDLERSRIERDLHDGAQQSLVALKIKLKLLEGLLRKDQERAEGLVRELSADADETINTLRDLARGIYPPLLAERGLKDALEAQARKATVPVAVEADGVGRYPQGVEAAVYFCCLEALQNVQKYAGATQAVVRLEHGEGSLTFTVEDDGRGFDLAAMKAGSGIINMTDRIDAIGGRLKVESSPGRGVRIHGAVPAAPVRADAGDHA